MKLYFAGAESPSHLEVLRTCGVERVAVNITTLTRRRSAKKPLTDWATKYCTPTMARHVIRRFADGKTETQIAEENGISQQAVSKSLTAAMRRIREGLIRDGEIEAG